jgi:hypothetical protein
MKLVTAHCAGTEKSLVLLELGGGFVELLPIAGDAATNDVCADVVPTPGERQPVVERALSRL